MKILVTENSLKRSNIFATCDHLRILFQKNPKHPKRSTKTTIMALLCDKYRPTKLDQLDYNLDQAKHIKRMVSY